MRNLVIVLGDQLNEDAAAFDGFDRDQDAVWLAEVVAESQHVWSSKIRIAVFLAAMRHFRDALRQRGITVHYRELNERGNRGDFAGELRVGVNKLRPRKLVLVEPGEWRVRHMFQEQAAALGIELEMRPDRHFLCSPDEFAAHASGRKQLRLEYFYREMRRRLDVLLQDGEPLGGKWNLDSENRGSFSREGPQGVPRPAKFRVHATTREVLELVERKFADHPGSLEEFDWPVSQAQAQRALDDFIKLGLPQFGKYQDAMWTDEPYLFHSRISAALNLKLLDPRDVIRSAEAAYHAGHAPLNAVEGFIRQILGWREFVRGVYWLYMPEYLERNALNAREPLPAFYWHGETSMECLRQAIGQTLRYGYAHHIQRLMVTGLFAMLVGVDPQAVHEWYLAVYADAVEWVELPNSLGMSQYADGGVMASKPYAATGKYIQRMSNYCDHCRYKPELASGDEACPFTTLYWDFLARHRKLLAKNNRMALQVKNLERKSKEEMRAIQQRAEALRRAYADDISP